MLASFHLLYSSDSTPIGGFSTLVSILIVVGALYGVVRLGLDGLRFLRRFDGRLPPDPREPEWARRIAGGD